MVKVHQSIYRTIFVLFLLAQILFPSVEIVVVMSLVLSFSLLIEKRIHIPKPIFHILVLLGVLIGIGFVVSLFSSHELYDVIRDIIHFSKPFLLIFSGFLLLRKINDTSFFIKVVVYVSLLFAVKHLFVLATSTYVRGTIEELRLLAGGGNFIEVIGLLFLYVFYKKPILNITRSTKMIFMAIIAISIFFYFSRTSLLAILILFLSVYGYTILSRKAFEYSVLGVIVLGLLYGYLFTLDLDPDKKGIENFFYKIKNAPAEVFTTPKEYDSNNHKEIFDHWRGYEAMMALRKMEEDQWSYVFGKGFGSLIDLGFKAPIGGEDGLRYIPHFHNGYVYVFFKTGAIGIFFYLLIMYSMYKRGYVFAENDTAKIMNRFISGMGLYFIITTFVITGLYNLGEISVFLTGCFYGLSYKIKENTRIHG